MKLLMIIVDSDCKEELEAILARIGVAGYTEIPSVHGLGLRGIRMGSRAYPETSSLFFTVLPADRVSEVKNSILGYCDACGKTMKMFVWAVEEAV